VNKVYDGTTTATVTLSDDRVSGDDLSASYTTASFADKNVGSGKTVSVSGISVTGTDAANYELASTSAATTADITTRTLTVSATGVNKVYDGTTAATVILSDDRLSGDALTAGNTAASFADKNVGGGKTVSVSGISVTGTDANNYLVNTTATTTADITAATLTVAGLAADNKVYDGTNTATLNLSSATLAGVASGDEVTLDTNSAAGVFADANVGTNKPVTVSGLTLAGAGAGNYGLTQPAAVADITAAVITVTADDQTKLVGEENPTLTATLSGFVNNEDASVVSGGPDLTTEVTIETEAGVYPIMAAVGSLSATNYTFIVVDGTFTVNAPAEASYNIASADSVMAVGQPVTLTGIKVESNGIRITFTGQAGSGCQIQRIAALQNTGTGWETIGSATVDESGRGEFTDSNPTAGQSFYRTVSQ
jgi:hypothetical protein